MQKEIISFPDLINSFTSAKTTNAFSVPKFKDLSDIFIIFIYLML